MPVVYANIFQPLIDVFETVLVFLHDHVLGSSWGFSIIALTIIVRAALIPLTLKQFKSMQAMQRLSPQIKELQAKYKEDKQRLNQEMMKFYQENKVNPLGSCLPLALQMPVFLALFYMLRKDLKADICPGIRQYTAPGTGHHLATTACNSVPGQHGSAKFLFIPDLTHKAGGAVLIVLIVLYVGSQLASSLLMSVTADKMQRRLVILLPLFFVAFIINFPAGLLVYWITTNCWTIVQQFIVRRTVGPMQPVTAAGTPAVADGAKGGGGGLGGGLLAALTGRGSNGGGAKTEPDGGSETGSKKPAKKVAVAAGAGPRSAPARPPSSPRKKKKRSGRRR